MKTEKSKTKLHLEPLSLANIVSPSLHTKKEKKTEESCLYDFVSLTFKLDDFRILRETQSVSFTVKKKNKKIKKYKKIANPLYRNKRDLYEITEA